LVVSIRYSILRVYGAFKVHFYCISKK